jgi:hypothetical protein
LDGLDENAHSTPPSNFFILHSTCKNKELCKEIASDEASKKTSLTRL